MRPLLWPLTLLEDLNTIGFQIALFPKPPLADLLYYKNCPKYLLPHSASTPCLLAPPKGVLLVHSSECCSIIESHPFCEAINDRILGSRHLRQIGIQFSCKVPNRINKMLQPAGPNDIHFPPHPSITYSCSPFSLSGLRYTNNPIPRKWIQNTGLEFLLYY